MVDEVLLHVPGDQGHLGLAEGAGVVPHLVAVVGGGVLDYRDTVHLNNNTIYTVMQSDRNSSKTDTFHEPITYEPRI